MNPFFDLVVGPDGTVTLPAELLAERGWVAGSRVAVISTARGLLLDERSTLEDLVKAGASGADPFGIERP